MWTACLIYMMSFVKNMSRTVGLSAHLKIGYIQLKLKVVNGVDD